MREYVVVCVNSGEVFLVTHNKSEANKEANRLRKTCCCGQYQVIEYDPEEQTD